MDCLLLWCAMKLSGCWFWLIVWIFSGKTGWLLVCHFLHHFKGLYGHLNLVLGGLYSLLYLVSMSVSAVFSHHILCGYKYNKNSNIWVIYMYVCLTAVPMLRALHWNALKLFAMHVSEAALQTGPSLFNSHLFQCECACKGNVCVSALMYETCARV